MRKCIDIENDELNRIKSVADYFEIPLQDLMHRCVHMGLELVESAMTAQTRFTQRVRNRDDQET